MSLTLMQCHPDPRRLAALAARFDLACGSDDLDYTLHTLLVAAFGALAPKPFRYFGDTRGLLGYGANDASSLMLAAQTAPPDVAAALGLDRFATRPFPTQWDAGTRIGFEVRVRPTMRTHIGGERDIFQVAAEEYGDEGAHAASREAMYLEWLARELARSGAARLEGGHMERFQIATSMRKRHADGDGKRKRQRVGGPDAQLSGALTVSNPDAFAALLARGVGRHRAFGFGMLLLRPPGPC